MKCVQVQINAMIVHFGLCWRRRKKLGAHLIFGVCCRKQIAYLPISSAIVSLHSSVCLLSLFLSVYTSNISYRGWQRERQNGPFPGCVDMWVKSWRTHSSKEKMGHLRTRRRRDMMREIERDNKHETNFSHLLNLLHQNLLHQNLLHQYWLGDISVMSCPLPRKRSRGLRA